MRFLKVRENKKAGIQCDKSEFEQARMKKSESGWDLVPKNIQVVDQKIFRSWSTKLEKQER